MLKLINKTKTSYSLGENNQDTILVSASEFDVYCSRRKESEIVRNMKRIEQLLFCFFSVTTHGKIFQLPL